MNDSEVRVPVHYAIPARGSAVPRAPSTCEVCVGAGRLLARFGPWHAQTALDNIVDVSITGPYTFVKNAGPAHLSLADRGLTLPPTGIEACA